MKAAAEYIPYKDTGYFTEIVLDYLARDEKLNGFYTYTPDLDGLSQALEAKKASYTNRAVLVQALQEQYGTMTAMDAVRSNLKKLHDENTFTICTAHQPNIFTGHLYAIYKILHAIKLAERCAAAFDGYNFVPVYYMGSEDADLEELGHIFLNGEKLVWDTKQAGAVGRMLVDDGAIKMLDRIAGELGVQPFGNELTELMRHCYQKGTTIQQASFNLFNQLFGKYGLIVLIADKPGLKKLMAPVFADDLFRQTPSSLVEATSKKLAEHYKVQAHPRSINLFYLQDDIRQRIEQVGDHFTVLNTSITFTKDELAQELNDHPEHFSPNVILRGLYQETILPNIAFIGGGGELAYWLQFKQMFEAYDVPLPVLVLRNSFLVMEEKWRDKIESFDFEWPGIFLKEQELSNLYVKQHAENPVQLTGEITGANEFYEQLKATAGKTDSTLMPHVSALQKKAVYRLLQLEKKMLRAEKRKFEDTLRQIARLKAALFPFNSLQERIDNFMPFYAMWGSAFIDALYEHSLHVDAAFTVLTIRN